MRAHHPEFVFTYVAARTSDKVIRDWRYTRTKGDRYPVTISGVSTAFRRLRVAAKVEGFRIHDYRHDFATKLLRATDN